jgi:hypothetical protein
MIRIVIGVIVFAIGGLSFLAAESSPSGGTVWTGGMILGAVLVYSGVRSRLRRTRMARYSKVTPTSSAEDVAIAAMMANPTPQDIALMRSISDWAEADRRMKLIAHVRATGRL